MNHQEPSNGVLTTKIAEMKAKIEAEANNKGDQS
jgi:hypothetical protein